MSYGHINLDVPIGRTFSDVEEGESVVLFDSSGWLTLAVRMGSAAEQYGAESGDVWRIGRLPE
jgi:S-adenosylmethionine hydrolase